MLGLSAISYSRDGKKTESYYTVFWYCDSDFYYGRVLGGGLYTLADELTTRTGEAFTQGSTAFSQNLGSAHFSTFFCEGPQERKG